MKDYVKDNYVFKMRLASKIEVNTLATYLARKKWEEKQAKAIETPTDTETNNSIKKEKRVILKLLRGKVLVQDYKKFNISIFVYNYVEEYDTNTILSSTFRVLQTERGMETLEEEDTIFDLKMLKERPFHDKESTTGRHSRPKTESIQKAMEIKNYLKGNPNTNMDYICKEFGIAKTTYYRATKWLEKRYN